MAIFLRPGTLFIHGGLMIHVHSETLEIQTSCTKTSRWNYTSDDNNMIFAIDRYRITWFFAPGLITPKLSPYPDTTWAIYFMVWKANRGSLLALKIYRKLDDIFTTIDALSQALGSGPQAHLLTAGMFEYPRYAQDYLQNCLSFNCELGCYEFVKNTKEAIAYIQNLVKERFTNWFEAINADNKTMLSWLPKDITNLLFEYFINAKNNMKFYL